MRRVVRFALTAACMVLAVGSCVRAQTQLAPAWEFATGPHPPMSIASDASGRPYLYVAAKSGGLLVLDVAASRRAPTRVAEVPKGQLDRLDAVYVVQSGDTLYVALGNFFEAGGAKSGLAIVSVADPRRPRVLSVWTSDHVARGSAAILVDRGTAYLAAMTQGVLVFDVSDGRRARLLSTVALDPNFPRPNPSRTQHPNARGLAIRGDLLYVAYDAGGIRVVDVSDRRRPREVGRYINSAMGRKQQAYNSVVLGGPYAYVATDYCGMEVLDVSNPRDIRQLSWWNPWRCNAPTNLWFNSPGHTNQLSLDSRRGLVFLSGGDAELQVVDVSDPRRPRLAEAYGGARDRLGAWGITVTDRAIYLAYITTAIPFHGSWSGIKAISR